MTVRLGFLFLAIGLNAAVALVARWRRSVSRSGAVAGFLVGSIILVAGGFSIWGMLMLFFVSASVISRVGATAKAGLASMHEKGGERDAVQVLANGGAGLVGSILFAATGEPAFAAAAAGGFAAANADTWASELGVLSPTPPRSVVGRKELPPGASGGVTRMGTLASVAGSALIAVWFVAWAWAQRTPSGGTVGGGIGAAPAQAALLVMIITAAGAAGSLIDSLLGATVQALYRTESGALTERRRSGGTANAVIRGFPAVNNDVVNSMSTMAAAVIAGVATELAGTIGLALA
ncbi:MAG: DUF92 domain-containing protein [Spirochaetales bacterium]|nr:DUF92 domain-containing protein [Spirochaetales bacterium]